jgi:heme-degrading monooxygenase HmoA
MFARVTTTQGPPENVEQGIKAVQDTVLPAIKQIPGFKGILALADRSSGKMMGVVLWESEDAMRLSEDLANQVRSDSADAGGAEIVSVERFEVVADIPV